MERESARKGEKERAEERERKRERENERERQRERQREREQGTSGSKACGMEGSKRLDLVRHHNLISAAVPV